MWECTHLACCNIYELIVQMLERATDMIGTQWAHMLPSSYQFRPGWSMTIPHVWHMHEHPPKAIFGGNLDEPQTVPTAPRGASCKIGEPTDACASQGSMYT